MKKHLSIILMILVLVFTLASCDTVKGMIIKHEVTFNLDGGVAGEGYAESVEIGDGQTLALTTPTREGYNFLGWYSGETKITDSTPITSDMSLIAKWEIKSFKVTFLDYYGNTASVQNVNYGESATAPAVDNIIEKKRFDGWSADFSNVTEDMTVNALYVDNTYTITYDLGDKGNSFDEPCFYGELPKIPVAPTVEGYVFSGWFFDEELTDRYFFDYELDRDITLYARFYDISLGEYIVISNVDQLKAIADQPGAKYLLACDINCHGERLTPINSFSGELDGNGYLIHNFTMSEESVSIGFISTNRGTVSNLSFSDFLMEVNSSVSYDSFYGVVAAINYGTISNCHVLDSELHIVINKNSKAAIIIGGIVGMNGGNYEGVLENCTNKAVINADITHSVSEVLYISVGGIVGRNETRGETVGCANYAAVNSCMRPGGYYVYSKYYFAGGIVGENLGSIRESYSIADVTAKVEHINVNYISLVFVGGGVGLNWGKIYNSYSAGNVIRQGEPASTSYIGGFVGYNELISGNVATITKCFSTGSIYFDTPTVDKTVTGYGYFAGNSTGPIKDCYYLNEAEIVYSTVVDDVETNEKKDPTCTEGTAKSFDELTSVEFLENTLYFDRMIWLVVEGQLPTLR